jgi:hypothetical protein
MNPVVVILTDSLALPRAEPQRVEVADTWPQLLRAALPHITFHQISVGGATTDGLLEQFKYVEGLAIRSVVVQAGIVDCAPRALGQRELLALRLLGLGPLLRSSPGARFLRWLRGRRGITYLSARTFAANAARLNELSGGHLLWLQIVGATGYDTIVPGVGASIRKFNKVLSVTLREAFVPLAVGDEHFMSDGHHLNAAGHRMVFESLMSRHTGELR